MNLGQGWNIEPKQLLRLRILDWLAAQPMNNIPNVTDFQAADDNRHQLDEYIQALQEFDGLGWLDHHQQWYGQINAAGRQALDQINQVRNDRRARSTALQDALLAWLDDEALQGRIVPNISTFIQTPFGLWFGVQFDPKEVGHATVSLKADELITGQGTLGGGIIRPKLTPKGQRLSRSGRSIADIDNLQTGDNITVNQNAHTLNSQVAGRDSTQTMTVTLCAADQDQASQLVAGLRELDDPSADDAADEVEQAVATRDPGRIRQAVVSAQTALLGAAAADSGHGLFQLTTHLLSLAT